MEIEDILACLKRGEDITASQAIIYAQYHIKKENEACARIAGETFDSPVIARAIRERIDKVSQRVNDRLASIPQIKR